MSGQVEHFGKLFQSIVKLIRASYAAFFNLQQFGYLLRVFPPMLVKLPAKRIILL